MRNPFVKDSKMSNRYFVSSNPVSKLDIRRKSVDSTVNDSGSKVSLNPRKIPEYNVTSKGIAWSDYINSLDIDLYLAKFWIWFILIIKFHDIDLLLSDMDIRELAILSDSMDVFTVDSDLHDYVSSQEEFLRLRCFYELITMEIDEIAKNAMEDTNKLG